MKVLKKLLKARVIVWAAVTVVLVAVLIVANYLATEMYRSALNTAIGGKRAIVAEDETGIPFEQDYDTKEDAYNAANKVVKEICEEGMILLKNENNALPLKANAKVSVFGKNSTNYVRTEDGKKVTYGLVCGGSGSAAPDASGKRATIYDSLEEAGISYNPTLKSFYESSDSGTGRSSNPKIENKGVATLKTGETPYSSYTEKIKSSYAQYNDAAIVVFSRIAGENWDLPRVASDDENRHYLELDNNERELLRQIAASNQFQHIIVLMNGSNYIDLGFLKESTNPTDYNDFGKNVDGCIVIGSPGGNGIMALGQILAGKVNPSGHTVDTVYTNYRNDPTWENFGGNFSNGGDTYLNQDGSATDYHFVEYEENIYLGYRYYETRGKDDENWYNSNVVYPFGYGLSYTTFTQEITNKSALESAALNSGKTFEVDIKVKTTGSVPGKQVVQLYAEAPYTAGGIEKAYKVLVGFAKTKLLNAGAEETVKITVNPYDFASYDSQDKNQNSFKGYELEAGTYTFHAGTDAHKDFATFTKELADDVKFERDPVTNNKVDPWFNEVTEHMNAEGMQVLTRQNFAGTMPQRVDDANGERKVDEEFINKLKSVETTNNETYTALPTMGEDNGIDFKDLVGLEYDDEMWSDFLDQMTFSQMLYLFNEGCYSTADIEDLGIPRTISADGPTGFVNFMSIGLAEVYGCCYYQSECLLAQSYNLELATKQAHALGNEALVGNERGDGLPYPGWYAPGVNLHRSPFSGRNTEYYSEDPFLSGKMAATVIKGIQEKGVYCNVKHFAINDQETNRSAEGIATWVDEQAMRELYFKPFEFAVKEGKTRGLMTSFNRIGYEWAGGSYRLLTKILREEWGFVGTIICDFHTTATNKYMDSKQMLYAGGDINLVSEANCKLQSSDKYGTPYVKANDAKDANLLRRSAHNNLYAIVNSNIMKAEILGYKLPIWEVGLYAADGAIAGVLVIWGAAVIVTALLAKPKKKKGDDAEEVPAEPAN